MTDAVAAPSLTDVWNLFLAVAARQPIEVRVIGVLAVLVALVLIADGIRANVRRVKPQSLHIVRMPYTPTRSTQALIAHDSKAASQRAFRIKRPLETAKPHKSPRPGINRVSLDEPRSFPALSQEAWESAREDEQPPL